MYSSLKNFNFLRRGGGAALAKRSSLVFRLTEEMKEVCGCFPELTKHKKCVIVKEQKVGKGSALLFYSSCNNLPLIETWWLKAVPTVNCFHLF